MKWLAALVAVVVVALIVYPLVARPRETDGHRPSCMSHLKQIATAMMIYGSDYDDRLPLGNWADATSVLLKNDDIYRCPQATRYGYAMNMDVVGKRVDYSSSGVKTTVLLFDTDALGRNVVANLAARSPKRHGDGSHVSYVDTHVKWVRGGEKP